MIHHEIHVFLLASESLWKCNKQSTIALPTMEIEYMATSHYTKETIWLRQLLANVGHIQERPSSIICDNQRCIALAKNPTHHSRIKHIDVQHHFIREKLENQKICLTYYPTEDMIADMLTKPLVNDRHQTLTRAMGIKTFDYSQNESVEGKALDCS
jgi:hypothetical protein